MVFWSFNFVSCRWNVCDTQDNGPTEHNEQVNSDEQKDSTNRINWFWHFRNNKKHVIRISMRTADYIWRHTAACVCVCVGEWSALVLFIWILYRTIVVDCQVRSWRITIIQMETPPILAIILGYRQIAQVQWNCTHFNITIICASRTCISQITVHWPISRQTSTEECIWKDVSSEQESSGR